MREWENPKVFEKYAPKVLDSMLRTIEPEILLEYAKQLPEEEFSALDRKMLAIWVENKYKLGDTMKALASEDVRLLLSNSLTRMFRLVFDFAVFWSKRLDFTPVFDANGNPTTPFPFVYYKKDYLFQEGKYRVLITACDRSKFWDNKLTREEFEKMHRVYVFKRQRKSWVLTNNRIAEARIKTHQVLGDVRAEGDLYEN